MYITNYQIQNVLKVYTSQLSRNSGPESAKSEAKRTNSDNITISAEGRRQSIIDKVAGDIVDRITRHGPQNQIDHDIISQLQEEIKDRTQVEDQKDDQFVYNVIDHQQEKSTQTLMVEDTNFLLKRLEQIAKETVKKDMAP